MSQLRFLPDFFRPGEQERVRGEEIDEARETWMNIVADLPNRMLPFYNLDSFVLRDPRLDPRKSLQRAFEVIAPCVGMAHYPEFDDQDLSVETFNACEYVGFYWCELLRKFESNLDYEVWRDEESRNYRSLVLVDRRNPGRSQFDPHTDTYIVCGEITRRPGKGPGVELDPVVADRIFRTFNMRLESLTRIAWSKDQQRFVRIGEITTSG